MAYYAALVSVVRLLQEINNPEHPYATPLLDTQQIASLYQKFKHLHELLEDYSPKDHKGESADILERRIRDAAYEVHNIIESHILTTFSTCIQPENKPRGVKRFSGQLVSTFLMASRQLRPERFKGLMLLKIVEKRESLESVKVELDSIVEELMRINVESQKAHQEDLQLNSYISADNTGATSKVLQASSEKNIMVGFDEHLKTIIDQLRGESSRREVISIVGMGGLGKTTLARNIFDDKDIDYHFDRRAWVIVSQDYHRQNILLAIVDSLKIKREELQGFGEEELKEHIYKHLFGQRYLIIMDDVWDTKVLDDIKWIFPNNCNGSRIIITTRQSTVAFYASSYEFIHRIQFLNECQSWNLFCEKVFCPRELKDIGRLIVENCRGLPLAIVVVAGLLSKANRTRHDWEEIAKGVSSTAIGNDEHFSKILSLSYDHLPHHLKPCFLYLGGFPRDYEISISKLIKLWVAEGFIKPIEHKSLEEVAEVYLEDLVRRSLVLITEKRSNGKFKCCSVHDLLRDLCLQRARYENFLDCLHKEDDLYRRPIGTAHRLYIQMWHDTLFGKYKRDYVSHVRAILLYAKFEGQSHFLSVASGFKHLRVLDSLDEFFSFPREIVELLHLRYLALCGRTWGLEISIPSSIYKLQNLQTLIVNGETSLPSEIWKMPQLRHIIMPQGLTLPPIPSGERTANGAPLLGRLQTLSRVKDFTFTHDNVQMIPSLKKLKIVYIHNPYKNWEMFGLNTLVHLRQLETLDLSFTRFMMEAVPLPKRFVFPLNLKKLSLKGCELPWKDMMVVGLLPNLQVLKLKVFSFVGKEWETIDGQFPQLTFLQMECLNLKYWRAEKTDFPRLEHLHIRYCDRLEEIPPGIGDITSLQLIEVHKSKLARDSALAIQQEQQDCGNDALQVRVYFW